MRLLRSTSVSVLSTLCLLAFSVEVCGQGSGRSNVNQVVLTKITGNVTVTRADGTSSRATGTVTGVTEGWTIVTDAGARASLLFSNGSSVTINENTSVAVAEFFQTRHSSRTVSTLSSEPSTSTTTLRLDYGELIGSTKSLRQGSKFEVQTPVGIAGIRGTNWFLRVVRLASGAYNLIFGLVDGSGYYLPDEPRAVQVGLAGSQQIEAKLENGALSVSGLQNLPTGVSRDVMEIISSTNELIDDYFDLVAHAPEYNIKGTFSTRPDGELQSPTTGASGISSSGSKSP